MYATLERLKARREQGEGGFTLIELLIVIVILGILAAIVVFAVQNLSSTSAKSACQSDFKTVETAVEAYKAQEGTYPTVTATTATFGNIIGDTNAVGALLATDNVKNVGPWLKDLPYNASHYEITVSVDGQGTVKVNPAPGTVTLATVNKDAQGTDADCSNVK